MKINFTIKNSFLGGIILNSKPLNIVQFIFVVGILSLYSFSDINLYHSEAAAVSYIDDFKDLAIIEMHRSGIPASIILAQGLHESNNGLSRLALEANNHFGIKCKSYWVGNTFYHKDDDYN